MRVFHYLLTLSVLIDFCIRGKFRYYNRDLIRFAPRSMDISTLFNDNTVLVSEIFRRKSFVRFSSFFFVLYFCAEIKLKRVTLNRFEITANNKGRRVFARNTLHS